MDSNGPGKNSGVDEFKSRYRLIAKLGSGGMADVFLGMQVGEQNFEKLVVIKRIHARSLDLKNINAIKMFVDEARVVAALNHPHIVKVFDLNRLKNDIFITMEYVDGETLGYVIKSLAKANKKIPLPIACAIMAQACEALQYAHSARTPQGEPLKLIHRDIDPQNLMIDSNGYLKVIDFGVAKSATQTEMTAPGTFKGKLSYVAPDIFSCKEIDHRVDIYSLGLVLYAMATLRTPLPFKSDASLAEVINRILKDDLPPPSTIDETLPPKLDELIAKATNKDREHRFKNGDEFADAIRDFANEHGGIATTTDLKRWFRDQFEQRISQRREFESRSLKKAAALAKKKENIEEGSRIVVASPSIPPSIPPPPDTTAGLSIAGMSTAGTSAPGMSTPGSSAPAFGNQSISAPTPMPPPHRKQNVTMYALIGAALLGVIGVLAFLLSSGEEKPDTQPTPSGPNLFVTSTPTEAELFVNGERVGMVGAGGLRTTIEPGTVHNVVLRKDGFEPYEISVLGEGRGQRKIKAVLVEGKKALGVPASTGDTDTSKPTVAAVETPSSDTTNRDAPDNSSGNVEEDNQSSSSPRRTSRRRRPASRRRTSKNTVSSTPDTVVKAPEPKPVEPDPPKVIEPVKPKEPEPVKVAVKPAEPKVKPVAAASPRDPSPKTTSKPQASTSSKPKPKSTKTKWFSGEGNWSGSEVAKKGCPRCHNGGRAPVLRWSKKTKQEWRYFFSHKRHNRYVKLEKYFSDTELARAAAYIRQRGFSL